MSDLETMRVSHEDDVENIEDSMREVQEEIDRYKGVPGHEKDVEDAEKVLANLKQRKADRQASLN